MKQRLCWSCSLPKGHALRRLSSLLQELSCVGPAAHLTASLIRLETSFAVQLILVRSAEGGASPSPQPVRGSSSPAVRPWTSEESLQAQHGGTHQVRAR